MATLFDELSPLLVRGLSYRGHSHSRPCRAPSSKPFVKAFPSVSLLVLAPSLGCHTFYMRLPYPSYKTCGYIGNTWKFCFTLPQARISNLILYIKCHGYRFFTKSNQKPWACLGWAMIQPSTQCAHAHICVAQGHLHFVCGKACRFKTQWRLPWDIWGPEEPCRMEGWGGGGVAVYSVQSGAKMLRLEYWLPPLFPS